jgi:hypothetical protein
MNANTAAILASYGRSFLAACLSAFIVAGGDVFSLDADGLKTVISAGFAAVLPVLLRALNPNDSAFGKAKE